MTADTTNVLWWTTGISCAAILVAPAVALAIQRRVDRQKSAEDRRQAIFKALWVNRRRPFYLARVDALNMIDVEFFKEQHIQDAWQDLFAHYRDEHPGLSDAQIAQQREDKYSLLLFEIGKTLGYGFGKAHIRDNVYRPILHNEYDELELDTKRRVLELLKSDALPVKFVTPGAQSPPNAASHVDKGPTSSL
jgi:hypothetical protein